MILLVQNLCPVEVLILYHYVVNCIRISIMNARPGKWKLATDEKQKREIVWHAAA